MVKKRKRGRPRVAERFDPKDRSVFEEIYKKNRDKILNSYRNNGVSTRYAKQDFADNVKSWMSGKHNYGIRKAASKEMHTTAYVDYKDIFIENFLKGIRKFKNEYRALCRRLRQLGRTPSMLPWVYCGDRTYTAKFMATSASGMLREYIATVKLDNSPDEMTWNVD